MDASYEDVVKVARLAHEVNRIYCLSEGDSTQLPWDKAPDWQKESAINGVLFHIAVPDAGPDASHNKWLEDKKSNGWVYGPLKDVEKKEHPGMVPYEELPEFQKTKDKLFATVVRNSFF